MSMTTDERGMIADALETIQSELNHLNDQIDAQEMLFVLLARRLEKQDLLSQSDLIADLNLVAEVSEESGLRHQLQQLSDRLSRVQQQL